MMGSHCNGKISWGICCRNTSEVNTPASHQTPPRPPVRSAAPAGCHNTRDLDTNKQMREIAYGILRKRLKYEDLIADNGLPSWAKASQEVLDSECLIALRLANRLNRFCPNSS